MFSGIWDLFLHPDAFFTRISQEKVKLIPPFVIVGMGAILFPIIHVLFWVWDKSGWSVDILTHGGLVQHYIMSSIAMSFFMPFFIWGLFSVLIFGLSRVAGGTGSFPATLQNVGYGMVPWTLSAIIPLGIFLYRFITYTGGPTFAGYSGLWILPAVFCALPLLGIMIWSSYLWIIAVIHMDHLPLVKSAIITLVPVCVFLILSLPVLYYCEMIQFLMIRA